METCINFLRGKAIVPGLPHRQRPPIDSQTCPLDNGDESDWSDVLNEDGHLDIWKLLHPLTDEENQDCESLYLKEQKDLEKKSARGERDHHTAEDVKQEAALKFCENFKHLNRNGGVRQPGALSHFSAQTARVRNIERQASRRATLKDFGEQVRTGSCPIRLDGLDGAAMREAIDSLGLTERWLLEKLTATRMSVKEIARYFDVHQCTVFRKIEAIKLHFKRHLN